MLTFDFKEYCNHQESFEITGTGQATHGSPGQILAVQVLDGACKIQQNNPDFSSVPNTTMMDELLLLYQGGEGELLDTGGVTASTGKLVLCCAPAVFTPCGQCHVIGSALDGRAAKEIYPQLNAPLVFPANKNPQAASALQQLMQPLSPASASALCFSFLCHAAAGDSPETGYPPLVQQAIQQIHHSYAGVYGVEELAEALGVNKSYLIRSFTAAVGISPGKYLTQIRLENAKHFLLHGGYPLEVVAGLCGFSGANYFCKVFKRETGETPAAWRKKMMPQNAAPQTLNEYGTDSTLEDELNELDELKESWYL